MPNQLYAILKRDTIETIQFDGSFQAHLDTAHLLPAESNHQLNTTTSPISQFNNSTSFISLHKRKPMKDSGSTTKPFSYLYTIIQLVLYLYLMQNVDNLVTTPQL